jgi:hypothetical protein
MLRGPNRATENDSRNGFERLFGGTCIEGCRRLTSHSRRVVTEMLMFLRYLRVFALSREHALHRFGTLDIGSSVHRQRSHGRPHMPRLIDFERGFVWIIGVLGWSLAPASEKSNS